MLKRRSVVYEGVKGDVQEEETTSR